MKNIALKDIDMSCNLPNDNWMQSLFATRNEQWKYTNLNQIPQICFSNKANPSDNVIIKNQINNIVIINGNIDLSKSNLGEFAQFITIISNNCSYKELNDMPQFILAKNHIKNILQINIPTNYITNAKLNLDFYITPKAEFTSSNTLINIDIGENSYFSLTESYNNFIPNSENIAHLENIILNSKISKNANFSHFRIQNLEQNISQLHTTNLQIEQNATYDGFSLNSGCKLSRQEIYSNFLGKDAKSNINSLALASDKQHFDSYFKSEHKANNCSTNQHIRQIVSNSAKAIFYGSVYVPHGITNSSAKQLNKNIILGKHAKAYSRPELDIYNDDVICTHGSTTGTIDNKALFYLMSRGIDEKQAKKILLSGFVNEIIDKITDEKIKHEALEIMNNYG